ncbi:glycolate oxidase subunit GlcD [Bacillaceae bacterium SIJ1]|uniref:glycolate oxidase subunit GlcD n=1 Tax=Litoribacterium kuwaitense TaxID=1398745 RepID=UPI0013E9DFE7|nr:glycolate oxidase subunit GlcD [Litoribacterium kuwaitense]NGP45232.1 glycolate oxidase subunit GlcD [Litoribacterium kuwaitense]
MHEEAIQYFSELLGEQHVRFSEADRLVYSYDGTPGFQAMPDCIVSPETTAEVAAIVRYCQKHRIPIVPRGSGTNLSAGTCPTRGGVVLLFTRMKQILELDPENLTMTVQPGVITKEIHQAAEHIGLFYPPDPSSQSISTIGGNINENSGGLRGLKYGVTKDYVLGLEVVLANGNVIRTGGKLAKDVAGYDLTKLLVGSEGTLGIVTEATLKLLPVPETKKTILASFTSIEAAGRVVSQIIANKIIPATLEFMDQGTMKAVEAYTHVGLPTEAEAVLLIEQDGAEAVVLRDIEQMIAICRAAEAVNISVATTEAEAEQLRAARRSALSALARLRPTTILEDATVPRARVAEMVNAISEIAKQHSVAICTFGHAGDGNLHPTCVTDARDAAEMGRVEQAFEDIFAKAIDLGGTITGEHGVGEMKSPYLAWKVGDAGVQVMKSLKHSFDPQNIMNPGKMFAKEERKRVVLS